MDAALTWDQDGYTPSPEELEIKKGLLFTRLAGASLLLVGLMHGAAFLQVALFAGQSFPVVVAEVLFAVLALVHVFAGSRAYDGSTFFSGFGAAAAFGGAGFGLVWFAWMLLSGVLGLLPLLVAGAGGVCALACLASVPFAVQVAAARRRLVDG